MVVEDDVELVDCCMIVPWCQSPASEPRTLIALKTGNCNESMVGTGNDGSDVKVDHRNPKRQMSLTIRLLLN